MKIRLTPLARRDLEDIAEYLEKRSPIGARNDASGVTDFERLRSALARGGSRQAFLYAFDVIEIDGRDVRARPWHERRTLLAQLIGQSGLQIGYSAFENRPVATVRRSRDRRSSFRDYGQVGMTSERTGNIVRRQTQDSFCGRVRRARRPAG